MKSRNGRSNNFRSLLTLFSCLVVILPSVRATIYLGNETPQEQTLPSLPALFGRFMVDDKLYHARLQYLPENPYLCDKFDPNATSFARPLSMVINNITLPPDPVVLLASRGNCPFARKAAVAESVSKTVEFLIVYNYNVEGVSEDTLVPMFTENGESRLILLSVTHRSGHALRMHLAQLPQEIRHAGGPVIAMDSQLPPGMLTEEDLQEMMLSAIGLFFLLISFSGCIMILVGTYGQIQGNGRIVFNASGQIVLRTSLTEEQVMQLPNIQNDGSLSCAICLDDELSSNAWTTLPCQHHFHTDCIIPWLTERQPKCPLCKYDVLEHVLDQPSETPSSTQDSNDDDITTLTNSSFNGWWTRITRQRWTQVSTSNDGVVIGSDEMELTEQPPRQEVSE
jgi:hypothetical protein